MEFTYAYFVQFNTMYWAGLQASHAVLKYFCCGSICVHRAVYLSEILQPEDEDG